MTLCLFFTQRLRLTSEDLDAWCFYVSFLSSFHAPLPLSLLFYGKEQYEHSAKHENTSLEQQKDGKTMTEFLFRDNLFLWVRFLRMLVMWLKLYCWSKHFHILKHKRIFWPRFPLWCDLYLRIKANPSKGSWWIPGVASILVKSKIQALLHMMNSSRDLLPW